MTHRRDRLPVAALLAVLLGLLLPGAAGATTTPATFSMTSEPGDYVGQGLSYAYATESGDTVTASGNASTVHVDIDGANGDWWYLDLAAPSGTQLVAGATYAGATRYPFQAPTVPGLSLFGNGRGCNTLTGSFAIQEIAVGPGDVVTRLRATFEQHCEGAAPALRGTVDYGPPLPAFEIGATIDPVGSLNRKTAVATVSGTVTCSVASRVTVSGTVTQQSKRSTASAPFAVLVDCGPTPTTWRAAVASSSSTAFAPGSASVALTASASAGATTASATVDLRR